MRLRTPHCPLDSCRVLNAFAVPHPIMIFYGKFFSDDRNLFHKVLTTMTGILRHTGGKGEVSRGRRAGNPAVPTSTFGWAEMFHLTDATKTATQANDLEPAVLIAAMKADTVDRREKQKKRVNLMMLMESSGAAAPPGGPRRRGRT